MSSENTDTGATDSTESKPSEKLATLINDLVEKEGMAYVFKKGDGQYIVASKEQVDIHAMSLIVVMATSDPLMIPKYGPLILDGPQDVVATFRILAIIYPGVNFKVVPYTKEIKEKIEIRRRILR